MGLYGSFFLPRYHPLSLLHLPITFICPLACFSAIGSSHYSSGIKQTLIFIFPYMLCWFQAIVEGSSSQVYQEVWTKSWPYSLSLVTTTHAPIFALYRCHSSSNIILFFKQKSKHQIMENGLLVRKFITSYKSCFTPVHWVKRVSKPRTFEWPQHEPRFTTIGLTRAIMISFKIMNLSVERTSSINIMPWYENDHRLRLLFISILPKQHLGHQLLNLSKHKRLLNLKTYNWGR